MLGGAIVAVADTGAADVPPLGVADGAGDVRGAPLVPGAGVVPDEPPDGAGGVPPMVAPPPHPASSEANTKMEARRKRMSLAAFRTTADAPPCPRAIMVKKLTNFGVRCSALPPRTGQTQGDEGGTAKGERMHFRPLFAAVAAIVMLGASPAPGSDAAAPLRLSFVPHAVFFSIASRQASAVDPEVFVAASSVQAGLGFEQIAHVAGERSAEMMDDASAQALDANARPLGFDLQHWFSANGVIEIDPPQIDRGGAQNVIVRFANLIPKARYSLFVGHLDSRNASFSPLDGLAKANSLTADADGIAGASVVTPQALPHNSVILLVYHADHRDHGAKAGNLGLDAFHQLVVHVP